MVESKVDFSRIIHFLERETALECSVNGWIGKRILTPRGVSGIIQREFGGISSSTINSSLSGKVTSILSMNIRRRALELGGNYEQ